MRSGVVSCATSSTQAKSLACVVGAISGESAPSSDCFRPAVGPVSVGSNARHVPWVPPNLGRTMSFVGEDELLHSIRGRLGNGIELFGLRDDAGVISTPGGESLVVSVDSVIEGVHFDLSICAPSDVGWKALMQALSDLAAMGAQPLGALIALGVPPDRGAPGGGGARLALGVTDGVAEASTASGCPMVGGDV